MKEIFEIDNRNYNFRNDFLIKRHNGRSVYYGTETASLIGPKIWDILKAAKIQPYEKVSKKILKGGFLSLQITQNLYSTCRVSLTISLQRSSKNHLNWRLRY